MLSKFFLTQKDLVSEFKIFAVYLQQTNPVTSWLYNAKDFSDTFKINANYLATCRMHERVNLLMSQKAQGLRVFQDWTSDILCNFASVLLPHKRCRLESTSSFKSYISNFKLYFFSISLLFAFNSVTVAFKEAITAVGVAVSSLRVASMKGRTFSINDLTSF